LENRDWLKLAIVEFLGPFTLVFAGVGSIILTQGQDIVAIALAHGLAIGLMVAALGHISGGVFNPALTIGLWAARRIDSSRAIMYIIAQMLGALAGAAALTLTYLDVDRNRDAVNLGVPAVGRALTTDHALSAGNALVMEIILTFFLMFVVFGVAIDTRSMGRGIAGLAIGLTITMDILAGGAVSGAAMNPARWFGPAVIQGDFSDFWVWIVGPIVGAVVAAVVYNDVLLSGVRAGAEAERVQPEAPRGAVETEEYAEPSAPVRRRAQRRRR